MSKLIPIGTEFIIPLDGNNNILSSDACIVKVHDLGGGTFLELEGRNYDSSDGFSPNGFTLSSEKQIDEFAISLKNILNQSQSQSQSQF